MNVLIIEDDLKILSLLQEGLSEAGYITEGIPDGCEGLNLILKHSYDFIILDVMLPGMDGLEVIKSVRQAKIDTPAIFLSAKHTLAEKIQGLSAGGDDYITKPFSLQELLIRMEVILRRSKPGQEKPSSLTYSDLRMDLMERQVTRAGQIIKLQGREFLLLEYFLKNQEKILTKSMILREVLEYQFEPSTNVVDVFVHRLRSKIDKDHEVKLIQNIRGVGYVLKTH